MNDDSFASSGLRLIADNGPVNFSRSTEGLKHGGGGGTSGGMDAIDAKIAAAEARTDTKFAELRGDLKDFATKRTVWSGVASVIGAVVAAISLLLAILAFSGSRFDSGMSARGAVAEMVSEQHKRDDAQDVKLDQILARLPASHSSGNTTTAQ